MNAKWVGIVVVVAILAGAIAGYAGYTTGVQNGMQQAQNIRNQFLAARGITGQGGHGGFGGGANGQGGNRQFNPDNFTAGQVKSVNGNTIQLSTAQSVVNVVLDDQTQIQKMGPGTVSDIQTGERITVQGTRNSDGSFKAQTVQIGNRGFGGPPGAAAQGGQQPSGTRQAQGNSQ